MNLKSIFIESTILAGGGALSRPIGLGTSVAYPSDIHGARGLGK
jgi:hypothetical protein